MGLLLLKVSDESPAAGAARSLSLVAHTVNEVGRAIVQERYRPNELLPTEEEISKSLAVSRNVVREAIRVLGAKGLLRVTRGKGTLVQPHVEWNFLDQQIMAWMLELPAQRDGLVDDLSTLRLIIEPEVAALAAQSATTTETLRLFEAFEDMELRRDDPHLAVEADILFHKRLFEACHNRLMMSFLRAVVVVLRANFELAIKADHRLIRFIEEHRAVAQAVHLGDPVAARDAMYGLLVNNRGNLEEMRVKVAGNTGSIEN